MRAPLPAAFARAASRRAAVLFAAALLPELSAAGETYLQKVAAKLSEEEFARLPEAAGLRFLKEPECRLASGDRIVGSARGAVLEPRAGGRPEPFPSDRLLPWPEVTAIAEEAPGVVWIGTTRGAVRCDRRGGRTELEYFSGKRWLLDDRVSGIAIEGAGRGAWIATPGGISRIEYRPMRLVDKARAFEERLRARHVRHGLVASSSLRVPGDLATSRARSSDNDGLWTAIYVAAECFRHRVTGEREAREYARESMRALLRLEEITGIPGFPARSFIRAGEEERPADGEWHPSADGKWLWKGDTSSDEIVGHFFAHAVYWELVAEEEERPALRGALGRIASHILDHGYHLVDADGKPTRWGWWAPEEIRRNPDEMGLRALEMLSHLRVAHRVTGEPRFLAAYEELARKEGYAVWTLHQKVNVPGAVNHSDDQLAFLSYYPLLLPETDPELRAVYLESLERSWQVERPERNPLWNLIRAACTRKPDPDARATLETLSRIPLDLVDWTVVNSHRADVPRDPLPGRFGEAQALAVLPPEERPAAKWNANPYALDGGSGGASEDDGAYFLLPYWLGRYHGLIGE